MIYAFNPKDGSLSFHEEHYGFFNIKLDSSTGDCKKLNTQEKIFAVHGWLMWFSWTIIAMAQVIANRYCKNYWLWQQTVHNTLGSLAGILTVTGFITMLTSKNWHISIAMGGPRALNHNLFGLISFVLTLILILGGIFAWFIRR